MFLIRPAYLIGRLGGGLRRFVEVAARIHHCGVKYVIIESEPFLKSFAYFTKAKEVAACHRILGFHMPWGADLIGGLRGLVLRWLKLFVIAFLGIRSLRSVHASLVLAPGETLAEVIPAWICARVTGRRGAIVVQSDPFLSIRKYDPRDLRSFYAAYRTMENPLGAFVEGVIAVLHTHAMNDMSLILLGQSLSNALASRGIRGVTRALVENGVDLEMIDATHQSELRSDAIYIGRVDVSKGVRDLLHAWLRMAEKGRRYTLTIVGPTAENLRDELEDLVSSSGQTIRFLGALTDSEAISVLKSSRVFVLPSPFEASSLVTAEALACGVPVVSYDSPGSREFFPTPAVSMVPTGEIDILLGRVREILEDDDKRLRLGKIGKEFVSRQSWNKVADQEAGIYRQLQEAVNSRF